MNKVEWERHIPDGVPLFPNDREIEIGGYMGPRRGGYRFWNGKRGEHPHDPEGGWKSYITEKDFKDYLAAGFTFVLSEADAWYDFNSEKGKYVADFEDSDLYPYMERAERVGLPVVASAEWLVDMADTSDANLSDFKKNKLKKMIEDLSKYKMFKGLTLRDEPFYPAVPIAGSLQRFLKEIKPDIFLYTCMLPIYGRMSMFTNEITDDKELAYKSYIDTVIKETGTFVYDHYPLYIDNQDPANITTKLQADYYWNMELVASEAKRHDCETGIVVQSAAWGPIGEEDGGCHPRRILTKADVSFQVYSALAYGMKSLSYYTYWEHYSQWEHMYIYDSMVVYPRKDDGTPNPEGEPIKTPAYYAVQAVNEEIKKFDHVFLRFKWLGTMTVTPEGKAKSAILSYVKEYHSSRIRKVTATEEMIVGCQKDENGYDGFMVVNASDPGKNKSNKVIIEFNNATSALCYINGDEQRVDLPDGCFTYELVAGQGILIIPIK